ncbi:NUDIX domain-containing protein [Candidatus Uhrbacteria bacterium]|nr:NUDIX domain-containing protein [Candidatus Uhrbacteria bacterium]
MKRVFTVSAFLISNDESEPRVLLRLHPKLGRWIQPGGHIEPDQDPITALIAEFKEEVGIDLSSCFILPLERDRVQVLPLPAHMTSIRMPAGKPNPGDPEHFMIDMAYVIHAPHQSVRQGVSAQWFRKDQLADYPMPEDVRTFLNGAM